MRFSLFLIACTLLSSAVALPGRKPGTNDGNSKGKDKGKEKAAAPPAQPGDLVLVNSHDFQDSKINGHGSSERRTHPAVVVHHDEENHIVHVAPIGHEHPGNVPTIPAAPLGIPDNNGVGHIVVGPPKQIPHDKVKPLGEPRKGSAPLPARLEADHFNTLQEHIGKS